ncbi:M48 family metallopeptidase [Oxalobacteraceae bacterium]|nr:M48 family metallopeptidase [Oxalobacteraceae bacterium]
MTPPPSTAGDGAGVAPASAAAPTPVVAARYFDGKTSRLHQVHLSVRAGIAYIEGEVQRSCALGELQVSERSRHAVRKLSFPDGAYLEISDTAAFAQLLEQSGQRDSWVVRAQQSWRGALLASGACVALLAAGYWLLLPAAAGLAARLLPVQIERKLGGGILEVLDQRIFQSSRLSPARQRELSAAFAALRPPGGGAQAWRIVYRSSLAGPNAFALPSGDIVLTDQMVKLLGDDQAVMGVLAHELGHLHHRHLTRRLIQGTAVATTVTLLFGDVSSILVTLPTLVLDMKYSRDAETEADDYAAAMLTQNGIGLEHLERVFAVLERIEGGDASVKPDAAGGGAKQTETGSPQSRGGAGGMASYLSSHPGSAERLARLRAQRR